MKKNKKKKAAKKTPGLLGGAAKSLKKLGKTKLSTTQKVLAGVTLGVLGARHLVKELRKRKAAALASPAADTDMADDVAVAEYNLTTLEEEVMA